jgi:hypothetical protein
MIKLINAVAAASLLAGCAATATTTPATPAQETPMNASATLLPQRTVEVAPGTTLRYEGANDSRCPPDVRCVTAGEISYKFTLTGATGAETFALTKLKPAFDAANYKGVRVTLGPTEEPVLRPSTAAAPVVIMPVTVNITRP